MNPGKVLTYQMIRKKLFIHCTIFTLFLLSACTTKPKVSEDTGVLTIDKAQIVDINTTYEKIIVKVSGVVLQNGSAKEIVIEPSVGDGEVTLSNVKGQLLNVQGGGTNSIFVQGTSSFETVELRRTNGPVRVVTDNTSTVTSLTVAEGSNDVIVSGNVKELDVQAKSVSVAARDANLETVIVNSNESTVVIEQGSEISQGIIAKETTGSTIVIQGFVNEILVEGKEATIEVNGSVNSLVATSKMDLVVKSEIKEVLFTESAAGSNVRVEGKGVIAAIQTQAEILTSGDGKIEQVTATNLEMVQGDVVPENIIEDVYLAIDPNKPEPGTTTAPAVTTAAPVTTTVPAVTTAPVKTSKPVVTTAPQTTSVVTTTVSVVTTVPEVTTTAITTTTAVTTPAEIPEPVTTRRPVVTTAPPATTAVTTTAPVVTTVPQVTTTAITTTTPVTTPVVTTTPEVTTTTTPQPVLVSTITIAGAGGATAIETNGGILQMNSEIYPNNASNKLITWSVEAGTGTASINSSGLLTALTNGTVTVKAHANDGSNVVGTKLITISNQAISVAGITVDESTLTMIAKGTTKTLTATITPENATDQTITWSSSNVNVATVSKGVVSPVAVGVAEITATTNNGKTATTTVTVLPEGTVAIIGSTSYVSLQEAMDTVGDGTTTIELIANARLEYNARDAYGNDKTERVTIYGNGNVLTLHQKDSDWSSIGLKNTSATLAFENINVVKTSVGGNGAWNNHAIIFSSNVEFTNTTFDNAIVLGAGANLDGVTITEDGDYYGIWIEANGQNVTIANTTVNANTGGMGRGIKISDQYIGLPGKVTLTVSDSTFNTAKKSAIIVGSSAGAEITVANVDITSVTADTTYAVWVDEGWVAYQDLVTVTGGLIILEGSVQ